MSNGTEGDDWGWIYSDSVDRSDVEILSWLTKLFHRNTGSALLEQTIARDIDK